jgi:hypothetical protein
MVDDSEFAWLDVPIDAPVESAAHLPGREKRFDEVMRAGALLGKDRVWYCDGDYIAFRRAKANPATLERHNRFTATGDYTHIGTSGDVEVYKLNDSSPFKIKPPEPGKRVLDLGEMNWYNVRRQAALAACRRDWETFQNIVAFMREAINRNVGEGTATRWTQAFADTMFADTYVALMESIKMRQGPSPGEINRELAALAARKKQNVNRLITVGR